MASGAVAGGQKVAARYMHKVQQRTPEWLRLRSNNLNASEFAQAGGLISWQETFGRARLWERKVFTDTPDYALPDRMKHGIANEEKGREMFSTQTGKKVLEGNYWTIEDNRFEKSWLGCSPDGLLEDEESILEIKCPVAKLTKNFNAMYIPQVMGLLHVTGRKYCHFINWTEERSTFFKVTYNPEWTEKRLIPHLADFWGNHVLPAKEWMEKNAPNIPSYEQYYNRCSEITKYRPDTTAPGAAGLIIECKMLPSSHAEPYDPQEPSQEPRPEKSSPLRANQNIDSDTVPSSGIKAGSRSSSSSRRTGRKQTNRSKRNSNSVINIEAKDCSESISVNEPETVVENKDDEAR